MTIKKIVLLTPRQSRVIICLLFANCWNVSCSKFIRLIDFFFLMTPLEVINLNIFFSGFSINPLIDPINEIQYSHQHHKRSSYEIINMHIDSHSIVQFRNLHEDFFLLLLLLNLCVSTTAAAAIFCAKRCDVVRCLLLI